MLRRWLGRSVSAKLHAHPADRGCCRGASRVAYQLAPWFFRAVSRPCCSQANARSAWPLGILSLHRGLRGLSAVRHSGNSVCSFGRVDLAVACGISSVDGGNDGCERRRILVRTICCARLGQRQDSRSLSQVRRRSGRARAFDGVLAAPHFLDAAASSRVLRRIEGALRNPFLGIVCGVLASDFLDVLFWPTAL